MCGNIKKTLWLVLWILIVGLQLLKAAPMPQNPIETIGLSAISMASSAAEVFQNGAALRKEVGFETPLFAMKAKTAVGMGQAMSSSNSAGSDEDSDEDRRRRKRSIFDLHSIPAQPDSQQHLHLHRGKRSPCHTGGGGGSGTSGGTATAPDYPTDYDDPVERKRRQRKAAKQRAAKRNAKKARSNKTKKKKLTGDDETDRRRRRRRRQVEVDLTPTVDGFGKKISDHAKKFGEGMRSIWDSVVSTMQGMVQRVTEKIGKGGSDATVQQPSSDAEFI